MHEVQEQPPNAKMPTLLINVDADCAAEDNEDEEGKDCSDVHDKACRPDEPEALFNTDNTTLQLPTICLHAGDSRQQYHVCSQLLIEAILLA